MGLISFFGLANNSADNLPWKTTNSIFSHIKTNLDDDGKLLEPALELHWNCQMKRAFAKINK